MVILHGFWLGDRLSNQQVDILAFWLPRWGFLGHAIAGGHVPTWLPNQFGGVPFASDPQSGWLYLPAMVLFAALPAARAMEWIITLQPIAAGLGLYWFFRHEGLGRPAATFGGLALALPIAGSAVALSMPFAGTLAWTALALAGASAFVRARTALSILGWLGVTALCWSQIAAAHLTDGLLIGSAVLGVYAVTRLLAQVLGGERTWAGAAGMAALLFLPLVPLSAAAWLPRVAFLPRTSIGLGYRRLGTLTTQLSHRRSLAPLALRGQGPWWATAFARGLGGYLGATPILLIPVAFVSRRFRLPAIGFGVVALVGWALNLDHLIASSAIRHLALRIGIGELWLRDPTRFEYLVLIAFAALAGYGLQAWLDSGPTKDPGETRRRMLWLAPAMVVFVIGPLIAGSPAGHYVPFALGLALGLPLLVLAARGRSWAAPALAGLLAAELTVCGIVGQYGPTPAISSQGLTLTYDPGLDTAFQKLHEPEVDPTRYLAPGPIGEALAADRADFGRYLSFDERIAKGSSRGFLSHQEPHIWPAYENGRSILFGLDEIQGYSPVQLDRYWRLVRAVNTVPIFYNSATFQSVDPAVMRLFGVRYVIAPTAQGPPADVGTLGPGTPTLGRPRAVAADGLFTLWRYANAEPRASVVYQVRPVGSGQGLSTVIAPTFEPSLQAIAEGFPEGTRLGPHPADQVAVGSTTYRQPSPARVEVTVATTAPGLLLIRNAWDPGWHAWVDGTPATVYLTDYLMQGVLVPAGNHRVVLTYGDPWIGRGLVVSGLSWLLFGVAVGLAAARSRRRSRREHRSSAGATGTATAPGRPSPAGAAPPR